MSEAPPSSNRRLKKKNKNKNKIKTKLNPNIPTQPVPNTSNIYSRNQNQNNMPGQNAVVINQIAPTGLLTAPKTAPYSIVCPFCKKNIVTNAVKSFDCISCLLCYFFCICYCIAQCARGKECCCYNAEHKCPNCGQVVGIYKNC